MDKCLICDNAINPDCDEYGPFVKNPTSSGITTILEKSIHDDHVFRRLNPIRDELLKNPQNYTYHLSCRKNFCVKISGGTNVKLSKDVNRGEAESSRNLRDGLSNFLIGSQCFICGGTVKRNKPLISICTGKGAETRDKIIKAAVERQDFLIQNRMVFFPDLSAAEAKYHKDCYSHYISERNIVCAKKRLAQELNDNLDSDLDEFDEMQEALNMLCEEINTNVIQNNSATTLKVLTVRMDQILSQLNITSQCVSSNLSRYLKRRFENQLKFITRPGKTTIICSKEHQQECQFDYMSHEDEEDFAGETMLNEDQVLHQAAGILRRIILDHHKSNLSHQSEYMSANSMNSENLRNELPEKLYKFVSWVIDGTSYDNVSIPEKENIKAMSICTSILNSFDKKKNRTFLSLALSLYIHHAVKSKKIIDVLFRLGLCCSYDEVRCFLTTVASNIIRKNSTVYIPQGLQCITNEENGSKKFFHASIDNFDQNEETLDGKSTTHSMAMVLFQKSNDLSSIMTTQRGTKRSLNECIDVQFDQQIRHYQKPNVRPEPPKMSDMELKFFKQMSLKASKEDLIWKMLRYFKESDKSISWNEFNNFISTNNVPVSSVYYLPFINSPPTDYDTIYTTLLHLSQIADTLNQKHLVVTADLAIYSKAQEILWLHSDTLGSKITMQLGGMHFIMAFIASIGQIYGDGGLINILVDSGLYADNTCRQMLQGKQLSRACRGLILAVDALTRLFLKVMFEWAAEVEHRENAVTGKIIGYLQDMENCINKTLNCDKTLSELKENLNDIQETIKKFKNYGSHISETFKYWLTFLDAVDILLQLLRSERDANFQLHLESVKEALPYLVAGGRHNYARFSPIYLSDMIRLKTTHPDVYEYLENGNFVVKRSSNKKFNCVASDMALEQTVNKDCKSSSGVIGFTQQEQTLTRWIVTRHIVGEYATKFEKVVDKSSTEKKYSQTMKIRDEKDVKKILDVIEDTWINPFSLNGPPELIHIASGKIAPENVRKSLTEFKVSAKSYIDNYVEKTLTGHQNESFWKPMKKQKIDTFSDAKVNHKRKLTKTSTITSEFMFRRILSAARYRDLDFGDLLRYELTPVPSSLFFEDGSMRKSPKAELGKKIKGFCQLLFELKDEFDSCIIDAMGLFQEIPKKSVKTYSDIASIIFKKILGLFRNGYKTIVLVFDRYNIQDSIKNYERQRRGESAAQTHSILGSRKIIDYKTFLQSSGNKMGLIAFVSNYIEKQAVSELTQSKEIIIAGGYGNDENCYSISCEGVKELVHLKSNHEEADTGLILHLIDRAEKKDTKILIKSDDTDVLILLLYYYWEDSEAIRKCSVYLQSGHTTANSNKKQFIPINELANRLGKSICKSLPALHIITGCDTTSSFFKIGKVTPFNILNKNPQKFDLSKFSKGSVEEAVSIARNLVKKMYSCEKEDSLDKGRIKLTLDTKKPANELPPTEDAFRQHILRCYYQCQIWLQSELCIMEKPNLLKYGWTKKEGILLPITTIQEPIPHELREVLDLFCTEKKCDSSKCLCFKEGIFCSSECKCDQSCQNVCNQLSVESDEEEIDTF